MSLGSLLIENGLVSEAAVNQALACQRAQGGGRLGEILVSLGHLSSADLARVLNAVPPAPRTLAETGVELTDLLDLLMKGAQSGAVDTAGKAADLLCLPQRVAQDLVDQAGERQLVEVVGAIRTLTSAIPRFAPTTKGRDWAAQAFERNGYLGPAPVPLAAFVERIRRQAIGDERVPPEAVRRSLDGLIMSDALIRRVGPALNSGRPMLLYGPPGNGKTSVAQRIGAVFRTTIYLPHAVLVGGQIIKVFDPNLHRRVAPPLEEAGPGTIRTAPLDPRWVPCRRPFVVAGGELTLEMLDLSFNATARFYEAPLHVKALNGTFLIDDFGRQLVQPEALLNRWTVPMESRVDYLKLHTGQSFAIPFDALVIFSTNLSPGRLMDEAFLRRIPHKIEVKGPRAAEYRQIFRAAASARGIEAPDEAVDLVIAELTERNSFPLAGYQPGFLLDQVAAICKYEGHPPRLDAERLLFAIANLYTEDAPGRRQPVGTPLPGLDQAA
ncbi:MAG TPA: hypothetical protein VD970_06850 [Acetobacteraceae bacterium]|nr:hypothetical protein [Acetobacteraceae bacterium]